MASGVTGLTGRPAQSCVVQVSERGPEPVPNRPQPMAENNALVEISRHRSVMFNHAQVRYSENKISREVFRRDSDLFRLREVPFFDEVCFTSPKNIGGKRI